MQLKVNLLLQFSWLPEKKSVNVIRSMEHIDISCLYISPCKIWKTMSLLLTIQITPNCSFFTHFKILKYLSRFISREYTSFGIGKGVSWFSLNSFTRWTSRTSGYWWLHLWPFIRCPVSFGRRLNCVKVVKSVAK